MISVVTALLAGDQTIPSKFAAANNFWTNTFFPAHKNDNEQDLAKALGDAQSAFEQVLGMDRAFAKEVMAVTALGSLYDDVNGFEDNRELAGRLGRAFKRSMVSIEVKGSYLENAIKMFHLD